MPTSKCLIVIQLLSEFESRFKYPNSYRHLTMDLISLDNTALDTEVSDRRTYKTEVFLDNDKLLQALQQDLFCDVVLVADDRRIPAHRNILYAANAYFAAMFTMDLKERNQIEITMNDIDGDILQQLVQYCYTGVISIDSENVEEMTRTATMLQFTAIQENCTKFYSTILCVSNCLGIREIADLYNMARLREEAHALVLEHFTEVSKCDEFYQLNEKQLSVLLADDEINVTLEEDVLCALMRWITFNIENRRNWLPMLLEFVRFKHVKESFILKEFHQQCIEINCREVFSSIVERRLSEDRNEIPRTSKLLLHLVSKCHSTIEINRYCRNEDSWSQVNTINHIEINSFTIVQRGGKLIIIGGRDTQNQAIKTVKSIDLNTGEIVHMPLMLSAKCYPLADLINDYIYVFGGSNAAGTVSETVERFDFAMNEWSEVAEMAIHRRAPAHVVLSDRLFVIGGRNRQSRRLNSVECYTPSTNKWETLAPMRRERDGATACALNKFIYVFGGHGVDNSLHSIERYDSHANSWTEMLFVLPRHNFSAVIGDGDWVYLAGPDTDFEKINVFTGETSKLKELPASASHLIKC